MLLLARTGYIIRNLLLGTFADAIVEHCPLVVAVPDPTDERLLEVIGDRPITLAPFPEEVYDSSISRVKKVTMGHTYMYRFKQAEKQNASLDLQTRLWESRHSWLGDKVIRGLIGAGHLADRMGLLGALEERYLTSLRRWPITDRWREILDSYKPSVLVSTMLTHARMYCPSVDMPPILAARERGIPIGTLVQSWDNLASKTAVLPTWLDRYWTWSDFMSEQLIEMNPRVPPEKVVSVGSPQFDFHKRPEMLEPRTEYLERMGLRPDRPYILIGTSTRVLSPDDPEQTLRLTTLIHDSNPELHVLVRLHPKDYPDRWRNVRDDLYRLDARIQVTAPETHMDSGGFIPPVRFYHEQVNAVSHAEVVINMASTLTVDSAILDRPIVSIGFDTHPDDRFPEGRAWAYNNSTHFRALVETGGVRVVRSEQELVDAVEYYTRHPNADQEGRRQIAERVAGVVDGRAGQRLADEVMMLIQPKEGARPSEEAEVDRQLPSEASLG